MKFEEIPIDVPKHDCDYILKFPSGQKVTIQLRPSNADVDYEGSLDVILPENQAVTNWRGDDMVAATPFSGFGHILYAKQLATDLPSYDEPPKYTVSIKLKNGHIYHLPIRFDSKELAYEWVDKNEIPHDEVVVEPEEMASSD